MKSTHVAVCLACARLACGWHDDVHAGKCVCTPKNHGRVRRVTLKHKDRENLLARVEPDAGARPWRCTFLDGDRALVHVFHDSLHDAVAYARNQGYSESSRWEES